MTLMREEDAYLVFFLLASGSAHIKPLDDGAAGALGRLIQAADLGVVTPEHLHPVLHLHLHAGPGWKTQRRSLAESSKNKIRVLLHSPSSAEASKVLKFSTLILKKQMIR